MFDYIKRLIDFFNIKYSPMSETDKRIIKINHYLNNITFNPYVKGKDFKFKTFEKNIYEINSVINNNLTFIENDNTELIKKYSEDYEVDLYRLFLIDNKELKNYKDLIRDILILYIEIDSYFKSIKDDRLFGFKSRRMKPYIINIESLIDIILEN